MKYSPNHYAKAFCAAVAEHPHQENKFIKNFADLIIKNGNQHQGSKILAATEKILHETHGTKKITFISARPLKSLHTSFRHFLHAHDTIEEKTDATLIGGVKMIMNDALQFDGTLKRKVEKLFSDQ
ncbi:MAG: F0F1 ATP synthase subunit delta [Patescibacteria group bacterium]|nr:F0F1 ATP synthase subunit delta [Patescibacteria group bacterium]